jgi:hypothetical protein
MRRVPLTHKREEERRMGKYNSRFLVAVMMMVAGSASEKFE